MVVSPESIQQIVRYPWEKKSQKENIEREESLEDSLMEAENYEDDVDKTEKSIPIKNTSEQMYNDQNLPDQSTEDQNKNMIHELAEAEEAPKLDEVENTNEDIQPVEVAAPAVLELKVDKIDDQDTEPEIKPEAKPELSEDVTEKINIRVENTPVENTPVENTPVENTVITETVEPIVESSVIEEKPAEVVEPSTEATTAELPPTIPEVAEMPEVPDTNMEKIINLNRAIEEGQVKFQQATATEKEKVMESILPEIIEACEEIKA